jgi:hypothetical protein
VTNSEYDDFFELLTKLVNEGGSWRSKKAALLAAGSNDDCTILNEFAGWFSDEDPWLPDNEDAAA